MDDINIRKLHTIMVQIDESDIEEAADISMPDISDFDERFGISQADHEENHSLDGDDDDWLDSGPKASEIGLSKDFPTNENDPWGIGEGDDADLIDAPRNDYDDSMDAMQGTDDDEFDEYGNFMGTLRNDVPQLNDDDLGDDPWGIGEGDAAVPDDIQISKDDEDLGPPDDIQLNEVEPREMTVKLIDAMDDGMIDAESVVTACLSYMSEAQVAEMISSDFDWLSSEDDELGDDGFADTGEWDEG